jgi:hypothetical protein
LHITWQNQERLWNVKGACNVNHRFWVLGLVLGLLLAVGPTSVLAQEVLVVNVPFAFIAAGATHPAGEYRLAVSEDRMALTITPATGRATGGRLPPARDQGAAQSPHGEARQEGQVAGGAARTPTGAIRADHAPDAPEASEDERPGCRTASA